MISKRNLLPTLVFVVLLIGAHVCKAQVQAPAYTEIKTPKNWADMHNGLILISPKDVTKEKLIALVKVLRAQNKDFPRVHLQIVDDKRTAEAQDAVLHDKAASDFFAKHYVGEYLKNSYQGIEWLDIMPKGMDGPHEKVCCFRL